MESGPCRGGSSGDEGKARSWLCDHLDHSALREAAAGHLILCRGPERFLLVAEFIVPGSHILQIGINTRTPLGRDQGRQGLNTGHRSKLYLAVSGSEAVIYAHAWKPFPFQSQRPPAGNRLQVRSCGLRPGLCHLSKIFN